MPEPESDLDGETRDYVSNEVIGHLRNNGPFDEIRKNLEDQLVNDAHYQLIKDLFGKECIHFCDNVDLDLNRKVLREKLEKDIDNRKSVRTKIEHHIDKILTENDGRLREFYESHARPFLGKFIANQNTPKDRDSSVDMDIDEEEEDIERPAYSPIVEKKYSPIIEEAYSSRVEKAYSPTVEKAYSPVVEKACSPIVEKACSPRVEKQCSSGVEKECSPRVEKKCSPRVEKVYSPIVERAVSEPKNDQIENDESFTFSSVSQVSSRELSDSDNYLKLSDDEADIIGEPNGSFVSIKDVQGKISDLETIRTEPESSGVGKRTRRSNPRYSDYIS